MTMTTRRAALTSALCACLAGRAFAASAVEAGLSVLQRASGGRLGVYALDAASGHTLLNLSENERFAMCSTFKLPLAAAVLARVDAGAASLEQRIKYGKEDLLSYAPVTSARVSEGEMSVRDLTAGMIELSDNTAANLLLKLVDGPEGLTKWLRSEGDQVTRLDRTEPELNSNLPNDPRDTTTPRAMAETTARLLTGPVLRESSRELLTQWMVNASTGHKRIRAGLPKKWRVGDKTGTGARGAVNDVAIAWPEGRGPMVIAVYMSESKQPTSELEAIHARVAGLLA